jgi:pimeloyl-ACP methyl ester carboxylesterase
MMSARKPHDRYLDVNGLRLHYLDWGNENRQPLILLHGFMAHAHVWDSLALRFRSRYHVIALDQRGHGGSDWSREGAYTLDDHLSDITIFIEELHLKDVILAGHSMGGRHALFYAACSPHTVDRLILIDVRPAHDLSSSHALAQLLATFPLEARSLWEVVRAIRSLYPYMSEETCSHIANHGYRRGQNGCYIPRYDTRMTHHSEQTGHTVEDLWPFLNAVASPVLIIRGSESRFLSREVSQTMCRDLSKAELKEIPHSTHMPIQENPTASYKAIADFLRN